jgi:filamentous hemagglutinin family protein
MNNQQKLGFLLFGSLVIPLSAVRVQAQSITPEGNVTGTIVNQAGSQFNISGGQPSGDGKNLFHSFELFGLAQGGVANFTSTPQIQNIFARVTGGQTSEINGTLSVTGGTSNLFLMNPAGMIFGAGASLSLPGSFTATTANRIGFGSGTDTFPLGWFNATGPNIFPDLNGAPTGLLFTSVQPGSILNQAALTVKSGKAINLAAGTVITPGALDAKAGAISLITVPSGSQAPAESFVRFTPQNEVLSLNIPIGDVRKPVATGIQPEPGDISTGNLTVRSEGDDKLSGGVINLGAFGSITTGVLDALNDRGDSLNGGNISILANQSININGNINTASDRDGTGGSGGSIKIISNSGNITVFKENSFNEIDTHGKGSGNAGDVTISAPNGAINLVNPNNEKLTTSIGAYAVSPGTGSGGKIRLTAKNDIRTGEIEATSQAGLGGEITIDSTLGAVRILTKRRDRDLIGAAQNCNESSDVSLCTKGGTSPGVINISYGNSLPDFNQLDPSINGAKALFIPGNAVLNIRRNPPIPCEIKGTCVATNDKKPDTPPDNLATPEESIRIIQATEDKFTKEFESCLGLGETTVKTVAQIQKSLNEAPGKNALIYFTFEPPEQAASFGRPTTATDECSKEKNNSDVLRISVIIPDYKEKILSWRPINPQTKGLITYDKIRELARNFSDRVQNSKSNGYKCLTDDLSKCPGRNLYQLLIEPVEKNLTSINIKVNHLAFIPDRGIRSLPYAALSSGFEHGKEQFLVRKYSTSIIPSFSLIRSDYDSGLYKKKMWVMGASTFPTPEGERKLDPLPAEIQADTFLKIWNPIWDPKSKLLEKDFTKEKLLPAYRGDTVSIIHLITHGRLLGDSSEELLDSYIYVMDEKTAQSKRLTLREIGDLRLDAPPPPPIELMFYSACKASAESMAGELSFAGASVKSRVKSVVAGSWDIRSRGTFTLSTLFYTYLKKGNTTKAGALQKAQLAMLDGQVYVETKNQIEYLHFPKDFYTLKGAQKTSDIALTDILLKGSPDEKEEFRHPEYWAGMTLIGTPW